MSGVLNPLTPGGSWPVKAGLSVKGLKCYYYQEFNYFSLHFKTTLTEH